MRAKKAKSLRAMARKVTEGMPEREYKKGMPLVLIRDCTRNFYKRLKRAYMLQKKLNH